MKTVLIHAYECAPFHRLGSTIGAQRAHQFAKYLPKFGWNTIVLCSDYATRYSMDPREDWKSMVEEIVIDKLRNREKEQSLIIPLPSLQYADWIDKIWLSNVSMDHKTGTFTAREGAFSSLKRKLATFFKLFKGDHSQSWQAVAIHATEVLMNNGYSFNIQIAEHGPHCGLFIAKKLHEKHRIPWIIDFRDPIDRGYNFVQRFLYRSFVIPKFNKCSATIGVNEHLTKLDSKLFGKPGFTILNGFDPEEIPASNDLGDKEYFTIGYFGNVYNVDDVITFFDGLKSLSSLNRIKFIYRGNNNLLLHQLLKEKYNESIESDIQAQIPRNESLVLAKKCDVLLLFSLKIQNDVHFSRGVYPGKVFEYLGLEKPILLVPGDKGMLDDLIQMNSVGKIASSAAYVKDYIEIAIQDKEQGKPIWDIQHSEELLRPFTREFQAGQVGAILNKCSN